MKLGAIFPMSGSQAQVTRRTNKVDGGDEIKYENRKTVKYMTGIKYKNISAIPSLDKDKKRQRQKQEVPEDMETEVSREKSDERLCQLTGSNCSHRSTA